MYKIDYYMTDIDDRITSLGKVATWKNLLTCEEKNLFFNIMESISDLESIAIIREIRLEQIGI